MLKPILLTVLIMAFIGGLLWWLVPSRRDHKEEAKQTAMLVDSILRVKESARQAEQAKLDLEHSIRDAQRRSDEQAALILSAIRLQVQALSALAQRSEVIQRGMTRGLLTPTDTSGARTVSYTEPENAATLAQLRECDQTEQRLRITLESLLLAQRDYHSASDSLQQTKRWIQTSKSIEAWPGIPILTGENRMQRRHVKTSPFAP